MNQSKDPNYSDDAQAKLIFGLKQVVIQECNARKVQPDQIGNEDAIISGPGALQLDSLDAVEIVGVLERNFGLKLDNAGDARKVLKSFSVLSQYVMENADKTQVDAFLSKH